MRYNGDKSAVWNTSNDDYKIKLFQINFPGNTESYFLSSFTQWIQ